MRYGSRDVLRGPSSGELRGSTRLVALGERFVAEKRDSGLAAGSVATYERVHEDHHGAASGAAHLEARQPNAEVVFPSVRMRVRDPVNVENIRRRTAGRSGFEEVTTHALRKTAATGLDVAGMSGRGIAEFLGDAKPSLTQDVDMSRSVGSRGGGTSRANVRSKYGVALGPELVGCL